jgi:hypothetical protein
MTYPVTQTMNAMVMKHLVAADGGNIIVSDPTNEVLNNLNELMVRGGVLAGAWGNDLTHLMDDGLHANQSFHANQTLTLNVFGSDLRWFAGAATIQIIALILILPVFWGWWELGLVDLTLSPFHLANLFEAPLLNNVNSAAGARGIIRDVGNLHIKLGLIEASRPRQDSCTEEKVIPNGSERIARLAIAESPRVAAPYKGMRFRG